MQIQAAVVSDVPALSALLSILFAQEAEFTPDHEAQCRGLFEIISRPESGTILVAKDDTQALGMVNLLYTVSTALGERVALLEDMVVSPAARDHGLGTRLLESAIEVARVAGCKRITLLTDSSNVAAQRFYARHGFVTSPMIPLRLSLA